MIEVRIQRCPNINPFTARTVFISQDLTYKDGPRTEKIKTFLMAVDP